MAKRKACELEAAESSQSKKVKSDKGKGRAAGWGCHADQTMAAHHSLASAVQATVNCQICMDTFTQPLTLLCGHTFCHKCLWSYFHRPVPSDRDRLTPLAVHTLPSSPSSSSSGESDSGLEDSSDGFDARYQQALFEFNDRLICPACRTTVTRQPFPVFAIRDLADRVRQEESLTGLLYDPDAPPAAASPTKPPMVLVADPNAAPPFDPKDDTWAGLFRSKTAQATPRRPEPTRRDRWAVFDADDGVMRCVDCTWEIEDDECANCGTTYEPARIDETGQRIARALNSPPPVDRLNGAFSASHNLDDALDPDNTEDEEEEEEEGYESSFINDHADRDSDADSPLGSEYEIESVRDELTKKKEKKRKTVIMDSDEEAEAALMQPGPSSRPILTDDPSAIDSSASSSDSDSESEDTELQIASEAAPQPKKKAAADDREAIRQARLARFVESAEAEAGPSTSRPKSKVKIADSSDVELLPPKKKSHKKEPAPVSLESSSSESDLDSDVDSDTRSDSDASVEGIIQRKKSPSVNGHTRKGLSEFMNALHKMKQHTDDEPSLSTDGDDSSDLEEEAGFAGAEVLDEARIEELGSNDEEEEESAPIKSGAPPESSSSSSSSSGSDSENEQNESENEQNESKTTPPSASSPPIRPKKKAVAPKKQTKKRSGRARRRFKNRRVAATSE